MMEEEIRIGEQEREDLRIEVQRLREELSDLKIEAEILQDKIKKNDLRHMSVISTDMSVPESPMFDSSIISGAMSGSSSPLITTPPDASSVSSNKTPVNEPPSPPMSDASAPPPLPKTRVPPIKAPAPAKPRRSRLPSMDPSSTQRPRLSSTASTATTTSSRPPTRANTISGSRPNNTPTAPRSTAKAPATRGVKGGKLPPSNSLNHIRTLTAQMQRLEARVHTARSRLPAPAPAATPPRASPVGPAVGHNVTIRSSRKRGSISSVSTHLTAPDDTTPTGQGFNRSVNGKHVPRLSTSGVSRLSFGPGPLPNRGPHEDSRPSSRASNSSYARSVSRVDSRYDSMIAPPRPGSRAGGAYTPRPISRASFGSSLHGHSMSISTAEEEEPAETIYRTPSRRGTFSRLDGACGIPTPSGIPMPSSRRTSAVSVTMEGMGRRPSITPKLGKKASTQFGDIGETY